jgi:hypothetical protein
MADDLSVERRKLKRMLGDRVVLTPTLNRASACIRRPVREVW